MAGALSPTHRSVPGRRRLALVLLVAAVLVVHWAVTARLAAGLDAVRSAAELPPPIEVTFVRELQPSAPPAVAPPARPRPRRAAAPVPAPAASAPEPARAEAVAPPEAPAETQAPADVAQAVASSEAPPEGPATPASDAPATVTAAGPSASDAGAGAAFEWPPSTRLSYVLTGWYRGEVHGSAQVRWLREGERYQVHLDVTIGPSFAPLMSRRMISDGELTADGLRPRRYDELTQIGLGAPRGVTLQLDTDPVQLARGRTAPWVPGLQDSASQFVQLTWLFTVQPERLRPGQSVEFPLALSRRVAPWRYEVIAEEVLATPVGGVPAMHVRPSRLTPARPGQELTAEAWFAPTLQYLPVRIHIRQDAETYLDMLLAAPPQQAR